jgi:hypothetical protein
MFLLSVGKHLLGHTASFQNTVTNIIFIVTAVRT